MVPGPLTGTIACTVRFPLSGWRKLVRTMEYSHASDGGCESWEARENAAFIAFPASMHVSAVVRQSWPRQIQICFMLQGPRLQSVPVSEVVLTAYPAGG